MLQNLYLIFVHLELFKSHPLKCLIVYNVQKKRTANYHTTTIYTLNNPTKMIEKKRYMAKNINRGKKNQNLPAPQENLFDLKTLNHNPLQSSS